MSNHLGTKHGEVGNHPEPLNHSNYKPIYSAALILGVGAIIMLSLIVGVGIGLAVRCGR